jgi:membrane protein implicated in regulation of membrane protease activity
MVQSSDTPKIPAGSRSRVAAHPVTSAIIAILIFVSIFFAVWVPLYASDTPKIGDFPFFYAYLLIYMPVLGIVMWIVITLQARLRRRPGAERPASADNGEVAR